MNEDLILTQQVLWLGGAPCSGKSSVARQLAEQYDLTVYHCDDAYGDHTERCNSSDHPTMYAIARMTWDDIWMHPVDVLVARELAFYREEFDFILDDLRAFATAKPILVEGCALLPALVAPLLTLPQQAIWVVPTPMFQRMHYARRPFIQDILAQCSNPAQAWDNWMQRDEQFAVHVAANATAHDLAVTWVDGRRTIADLSVMLAAHWGF